MRSVGAKDVMTATVNVKRIHFSKISTQHMRAVFSCGEIDLRFGARIGLLTDGENVRSLVQESSSIVSVARAHHPLGFLASWGG